MIWYILIFGIYLVYLGPHSVFTVFRFQVSTFLVRWLAQVPSLGSSRGGQGTAPPSHYECTSTRLGFWRQIELELSDSRVRGPEAGRNRPSVSRKIVQVWAKRSDAGSLLMTCSGATTVTGSSMMVTHFTHTKNRSTSNATFAGRAFSLQMV